MEKHFESKNLNQGRCQETAAIHQSSKCEFFDKNNDYDLVHNNDNGDDSKDQVFVIDTSNKTHHFDDVHDVNNRDDSDDIH